MQGQSLYAHINKVKNKIIDNTLVFGTILGFLTYLVSLANILSAGFKVSYITDLGVIILFALIAFFRKKIAKSIKSLIIVGGIFVLVVFDVAKWGIHADNLTLLILVPLFSFLAFSMRKTMVLYFIGLFLIAIVGYLIINHYITLRSDFIDRVYMPHVWAVNFLIISIVALVIVIIIKQFNITFAGLLNQLEDKNQELAQREQNYRELFDASSDAIFIHSLNGSILDVNAAMIHMYGYTKSEIKELNVANLSSGNKGYELENAIEHLKEAMATGSKVFDWEAKRKNGELFWVEVALKRAKIVDDDVILAVVRDIDEKKKLSIQLAHYRDELEELVRERTKELQDTNEDLQTTNEELHYQSTELQKALSDLKKAQERLVQSEKMASLGTLSSGVAHEINNPLNFIKGGFLGLQDYFENNHTSDKNVQYFLKAIDEGVNRAATIVHSLNRLSRPDDTPKELCSIHKIIDNCLMVLSNKIKNRIDVEKKYFNGNDSVLANDSKLHQAFLNIMTNSVQAIENKGLIKINTEIKSKNLYIYISDNGTGINEVNLAKITEPFFTTKAPGEGTGLGLSMAYNIIKEHGGSIFFASELNKGTTVTIELPIIKEYFNNHE